MQKTDTLREYFELPNFTQWIEFLISKKKYLKKKKKKKTFSAYHFYFILKLVFFWQQPWKIAINF